MIKKYSILLFALLLSQGAFAQKNRLAKAEDRYDHYSYIDAREIYLKVVDKGYESAEIFKKLGDTYYYNAEYKDAVQWYTRLYQQFPDEMEVNYYFKTVQCYKNNGQHDKAAELMDKIRTEYPDRIIVRQYTANSPLFEKLLSTEEKYSITKTVINTDMMDFAPAFFGADKLVFASNNNANKTHDWTGTPYYNLFEATIAEDGGLHGRTELEGDIKSDDLNESSATFTKDGQTVYFTRNNQLKGRKAKRDVMRHKIYKATLDNGAWTNIEELPFNRQDYSVAHPALSPDEKRLYFASDMPGTAGASDLWFVEILGGNQYGEPVNLGTSINTEVRETFPFVSEENILYFASDGRYGLGGLDIYSVELGEDGFPQGEISTFGQPVNSPYDDFGFIIDNPRELIYLTSNRENNTDDIYFLSKECEILLQGIITDAYTGELLPGAQVVLLGQSHQELARVTVGDDAHYEFQVACEEQFTVRATKEAYRPKEVTLETPEDSGTIEQNLELEYDDPCHPNDLGCRLTLQPIYFDFDKHNIRPDAAIELAKILAAMEQYPELKIHIESHTDSRGSDAYNLALSDRRAQSTRLWLIEQGINTNRLTAKGYGETRLVNHCANDVPCSVEEHQLNRRSMFIIMEE